MSTYTEDNNSTNISSNVAVSWPSNSTLTLINYTGGPGVVESIQLTDSAKNYNAILNISIDGGAVQSCCGPAFFGFALDPLNSGLISPFNITTYGGNTNICCGVNNKNYIGQCTQYGGWACTKRVFIPFTTGIMITLSNNSSSSIVNFQVLYRKWPSVFPLYYSIGTRRKYWHIAQSGTWASPIVLAPYATINTSITGTGQIEFITHVLYGVNKVNSGDGSCNPTTCLEGECTLTIDGVTNTYGRTDNFWGGQYYWQNGKSEGNGPDEGLFSLYGTAISWQGKFNMHAYKFCYDKPIFFNESFTFGWTYGNTLRSSFGQGVTSSSNIVIISYWLDSSS